MLLIGAFACIAAFPLFALADDPRASSRSGRLKNLDGLRGYLALSVALHHGVIYHGYLTTGRWAAPHSNFFNQLGQASVALFFIITGYLFSKKILASNGTLDYPRLLVGRVFRIGPVYIALMTALTLWALVLSHFTLRVPNEVVTAQILQNFALGILPVVDFNGFDVRRTLAGVTWTLIYEWEFYFALPLIGVLVWRRDLTLPLVVGLLAISSLFALIARTQGQIAIVLFLIGLLCATIDERCVRSRFPSWLNSTIAAALLTVTYLAFPDTSGTPWPVLLLGLSFYFITSGADLFGLLSLKASQRLGAISYDLYLCHGVLLAAAFGIVPVREAALSSPVEYWLVLAVTLLVALGLALTLHVFVERPGINFGKQFLDRVRSQSFDHEERISSENEVSRPMPAE